MKKENKKKIKKVVGFCGKALYCGAFAAAAIGAAPFDKGTLMRNFGKALTSQGSTPFRVIDQWVEEE